MKLTKEECLEAIKSIEEKTTDVEDYSSIPVSTYCYTDEELNVLEQLIKEYFDNPPLKFEELEKGQWVWDSKTQIYVKVFDLFIDEKGRRIVNIKWGMNYFRIEFEEGRFYRKQVK